MNSSLVVSRADLLKPKRFAIGKYSWFGLLIGAALLAACSRPSAFDDGPRNIAWREALLMAGVGDSVNGYYPRISEMNLTQASQALGPCMALARECGEQMLATHPELRGSALTIAWRSSLQQAPSELVPLLLERGAPADAEAMDTAMRRPPQQVAERLAVIRHLLLAGAPVDAEDFDGLTALHRAARDGDSELVALLLSFGADRARPTRTGITALQLAQAQGAQAAVALLQR